MARFVGATSRRLGESVHSPQGGGAMPLFPNPLPSWRRFVRLTALFVRSKAFFPSTLLFVLILLLLGGAAWLNYSNNLIYGDVMTAIDKGDADRFAKCVTQFVLFFLLLTLVGVSKTFIEERLGLLLRRGLTEFLIENYLAGRAYLRLTAHPEVDNPDQRITEDVKTFTANALSFVLIVINSALSFFVMAHILRGISPRLVWAAAVYAALGSLITVVIGKRLVSLNIDQLHKEADLRFELVRTREHAEAIALQHDEARQGPRLLVRLKIVVENMQRIIARNALLGLFTTTFNSLIVVVPILIVAPLVIRGEQEIGKVTQAVDAFRFVVNAFSVLVTEFPRLTLLTAVLARLAQLTAAIRTPPKENGLKLEVNGDLLEVRDLVLSDPTDGHQFFAGCRVNFTIEPGQHTLIVGRPGSGKSELLRTLAGLWATGHGTVIRPPLDRIAFVSPVPYLTPGSLRQLMTPFGQTVSSSNRELLDILSVLHLDELAGRVGGLDNERDWSAALALNERQSLALARLLVIRPKFAVLNEATGTLDGPTRRDFYKRLAELGVTIVTLSARPILPEFHVQHITLPGGMTTTAGPAAA
jgi:vitamin B12/bleomycin/antimicrobial peptide transport system ATP-binding/permease protein